MSTSDATSVDLLRQISPSDSGPDRHRHYVINGGPTTVPTVAMTKVRYL